MKKTLLAGLVTGAVLQLSGCIPAYTAATTPTKTIYKGVHPLTLKQQKPASNITYLTINGAYYELPNECLLIRSYGDMADNRQFGDDAESRNYGDMADDRKFGDDVESRSYGDDAERREFGDDAESREFGDDAESRNYGDMADNRQFGDDAESREFGDDAESRNYGDMADNRQFGDDAESRSFGDDAESREFGGVATQFRCLKIQNINKVVVSGFIGQETILVNNGTSFSGYERDGKTILLKF
ncbi:hypothetical protein [Kangiella sp.]|uniref:hypothetical protein n=1 Tax=Kangiella sp. TaxID=1920245 RepID=UPI0019C5044A|nr:hypothetical protein [Kangiella sp.]MBD3652498.1 hypothetical protein [Kangiella sp.]